jgi:hypothetical protein
MMCFFSRLASFFACSNNDATYFWLFCRSMSIFEIYSLAFNRIIFREISFLIYTLMRIYNRDCLVKNHSPWEGLPLSGKGVQLIYIWIEIFQNVKANLFCTKLEINSRGNIFVSLKCWMCDQFHSHSYLLGEMLLAC